MEVCVKSFCLFFTGRITLKKVVFPAPLVLNGVRLPWREKAVHLGHTLHQDLTLNADAQEKRARFISKSVEVRSQFAFAAPPQILKAVPSSGLRFIRVHVVAARLSCSLPFTYLVEGHLGEGTLPLSKSPSPQQISKILSKTGRKSLKGGEAGLHEASLHATWHMSLGWLV